MRSSGKLLFGFSVFFSFAMQRASSLIKPFLPSARQAFRKFDLKSSVKPNEAESKETGHQSGIGQQISPEDEKIMTAFKEQQAKAARISMAEEVRTLIDRSLMYGTLSTNSDQLPGYPTGSVVGFELDDDGMPFFVFSTMSAHTKDILKDGRCSLTVLANDFKGAAEGRVVIIGDAVKLFDKDRQIILREKYLKRHPTAYWIDFGDFSYFGMKSIALVRYVGGFAMAGSLTPEQFLSAKPDPLAPFAAPVIKHMNEDHSDSTIAMVKHYAGVSCTEAEIVSLDRLGLTVKAKMELAGGGYAKVRLPFPREVTERKAVKEVLVEMTRAAASSSAAE